MISIFNGRSRALGEGGREDIYLQVSIKLRKHLHRFKGAKLAVFISIALHTDRNGWSTPDLELIRKETSYNCDTISSAITELCKLTINGCRVMLRDQSRQPKGQFGKNRYLLFPSEEEVKKYEPEDSPYPEKPGPVEPGPVEPCPVNPGHGITMKYMGEPVVTGEPHTGESAARVIGSSDEKILSRHSFEVVLSYLETQKGVNNAGAVATNRMKDGLLNDVIDAWLKERDSATATPPKVEIPGEPDSELLGRFLAAVRSRVNATSYATWFAPIDCLTREGDLIHLAVPNEIFRDWITSNYFDVIEESLIELELADKKVVFHALN